MSSVRCLVYTDRISQFAAIMTLGTLPDGLAQDWVVGGHHQLRHPPGAQAHEGTGGLQ